MGLLSGLKALGKKAWGSTKNFGRGLRDFFTKEVDISDLDLKAEKMNRAYNETSPGAFSRLKNKISETFNGPIDKRINAMENRAVNKAVTPQQMELANQEISNFQIGGSEYKEATDAFNPNNIRRATENADKTIRIQDRVQGQKTINGKNIEYTEGYIAQDEPQIPMSKDELRPRKYKPRGKKQPIETAQSSGESVQQSTPAPEPQVRSDAENSGMIPNDEKARMKLQLEGESGGMSLVEEPEKEVLQGGGTKVKTNHKILTPKQVKNAKIAKLNKGFHPKVTQRNLTNEFKEKIAANAGFKNSGPTLSTHAAIAIGALSGVGLTYALTRNRGQQSNAQLYGQQPLY